MIEFNVPTFVGKELEYVKKAISNHTICGDGEFTKLCSNWIENKYKVNKAFLTTSCTHALEMAAYLCDIKEGDEVIMPSFTFVSTADAFVLRRAKIVFVDINPKTMNIDENIIERAITNKTKSIVAVHYAGVACEMDTILDIAHKHNLLVIEDAAQGVNAFYKGRALGTIGDFGCYSFHETKNYSMGEGGALLFNREKYIEKAEILREKGTDRSKFFRGQIDKYSWVDYGSSYLPSDMNAAYLWAQLEVSDDININRINSYNIYYKGLQELADRGVIELPYIPSYASHNAHMFYIKVTNIEVRTRLISYLRDNDIMAVFHYIPLHSSVAGKRFGKFFGDDIYTTRESERLLRLPMYYGISEDDITKVIDAIYDFFKE